MLMLYCRAIDLASCVTWPKIARIICSASGVLWWQYVTYASSCIMTKASSGYYLWCMHFVCHILVFDSLHCLRLTEVSLPREVEHLPLNCFQFYPLRYHLVTCQLWVEVYRISRRCALPQHWSVLRAIHTLNTPQNYIRLLRGLSPIHLMHQRGAQGLMWGARRLFLPAAAMVSCGCVGRCWPLAANVRMTYCRNRTNCLRK